MNGFSIVRADKEENGEVVIVTRSDFVHDIAFLADHGGEK